MALFKVLRGNSQNLKNTSLVDGQFYFCTDNGQIFIDYLDSNNQIQRKQINAKEAETLLGYDIAAEVRNNNAEIPTSQAVQAFVNSAVSKVAADYKETIIGLSVDGQTVTYIKGDGSTHSFTTQDTDTTYSLGTDSVTGLTKLYATTGSAEDGTMTQKAIKTELDKKVGVSIDATQHTLIFTI